jgi:hypothetical protein
MHGGKGLSLLGLEGRSQRRGLVEGQLYIERTPLYSNAECFANSISRLAPCYARSTVVGSDLNGSGFGTGKPLADATNKVT